LKEGYSSKEIVRVLQKNVRVKEIKLEGTDLT
jgi:hypothetical protein